MQNLKIAENGKVASINEHNNSIAQTMSLIQDVQKVSDDICLTIRNGKYTIQMSRGDCYLSTNNLSIVNNFLSDILSSTINGEV
jgi:hypothetical protein